MPDLNMDRVVELLKAKGVNAYVEQTGGGVATIYAGPSFDDPDYGTRYAACAGPGTFGWQRDTASMGHTDEFCVGADDMGEEAEKYRYLSEAAAEAGGVPVEQEAAEEFAAQMIYDRVVQWAAEQVAATVTANEARKDVTGPTTEDYREAVHEVLPLDEDGSDVYFDLCGAVVKAAQERVAAVTS